MTRHRKVTPLNRGRQQTVKSEAWLQPDERDPSVQALMLYGICGDSWDGFVSDDVVRKIAMVDQELLPVHLNTPGGSVWEGIAIYNHLWACRAEIHIIVDGLAASMGSYLAMVGSKVSMYRGTMMMIHNPWTVAAGDAQELRKNAELLDKVRDQLVAAYMDKSGLGREEIVRIMDEETYLTAEEAVEMGFADEIIEAEGAEDRMAALDLSLLNMAHAPKTIRQLSNPRPQTRARPQSRGGKTTMSKQKQSASLMVAVAAGLTTAFDTLAVDTQTGTELKSQMAEISNLKVEDIDAILAGEKTDISLDQVDQMAFVLDTDLHTLMGAEPQAPEPPKDPVEAFAAAVKGKKLGVNASVAAFTNDPVAVLDSIINAATDAAAEKRESDVVARAKDIKDKCRQANRPEMAMELFLEGLSPEETRERLLNELASQQRIDTTLSTEASLGGHQPAAIDTYAIYEKRRKAS